ncbi:hypothetical protein pb186bvf_000080 [Paramecium bursaria]
MRKFYIIGLLLIVVALVIQFQPQDQLLRKLRHQNNHNIDAGYTAENSDCQKKCNDIEGQNCGKQWQNCCFKGSCDEGFFSDVCSKRKPVLGCTSA